VKINFTFIEEKYRASVHDKIKHMNIVWYERTTASARTSIEKFRTSFFCGK